MLQAEIGSAKVTAAGSLPTPGHLMPDFTLGSSDGKQVTLYDYRGRSNLAIFFAARAKESSDSPVLSALAEHYGEIAKTDSEVVVVLAESPVQADGFRHEMHFPYPVLSDPDMKVHNMVGRLALRRSPPRSTLLTGFWRSLPCGARALRSVYLTFRMFSPGLLIWTVSVLNARKSNGQRTTERGKT